MSLSREAPTRGQFDLDSFPDLVFVVRAADLQLLDVNERALAVLGWPTDALVGKPLDEFGIGDDIDFDALLGSALENRTVHFDIDLPLANGGQRSFNFAASAAGPDRDTYLFVGREMEALTQAHSQLSALLKLADLTDDIFVVSDRLGVVTYANAAASRTHGMQEFVGRHVSEFVHEDDTGFRTLIAAVLNGEERSEARVLARREDGSPFTLEVRMVYHADSDRWFTVERDMSDAVAQERQMAALTADLRTRATTDELTGLANRAALNEILDSAIASSEPFALLLLDMDDFKSVNDDLGHAAGDEFLQCVARRIEGVVGSAGRAARLGGDEFVVYLPDHDGPAAAEVANRVVQAISEPYAVSGERVMRSCSIGVAARAQGDDSSAVLRKADRAAYAAKHRGRDRYVLH